MPCRINRQRLWTIRLVLEASQHQVPSLFATLTISDKFFPEDGSVSVYEAQLFLKAVRRLNGPFRYFLVGEYGSRTWRPHYHAALFGVRDRRCVAEAWGETGHVRVSEIGVESARYLAGYTCKKLTDSRDSRLCGRRPEFARMSLKPGIGAFAADRIGAFYSSRTGASVLAGAGDVSTVVRQGQQMWPLGRYLAARVRSISGMDEELRRMRNDLVNASNLKQMGQEELNSWIASVELEADGSLQRADARLRRSRTNHTRGAL